MIRKLYLRFQDLPIRLKLILSIGLPLLAIYSLILVIGYWNLRSTAYQSTKRYLEEYVSHNAEKINREFSVFAQIAKSTADFLTTNPDISESKLYEMLKNNVQQNPHVYGACLAFEPFSFDSRRLFAPYVWRGKSAALDNPTAELLTMDVGRDAYDYLVWPWFTNVKKVGKPIWTEPFFDKGAGDIVMVTHTAPFFKDGKFRGTSNIDIHLEKLQDWGGPGNLGGKGFVIISREGHVLAHPNPNYIMKYTAATLPEVQNRPDLKAMRDKIISGKKGVDIIKKFPLNEDSFIVYAPVESTGWIFIAAISESEIMAPVWRQLREFSFFMLLGLVVIVVILMIGSFKITDPMRKLAQEVRNVAAGKLEVNPTCAYTKDETGQLAATFHKMVEDLKNHIQALTRETAHRESVESELRIARNIQTSLLPRKFPPFPEKTELDLHALNVPARHVGGDFFDFFFVNEDELILVIADVSGKGVPAAMFMAVARTHVRNIASDTKKPSEILDQVNQILMRDNESNLFVTMAIARYNIKTGNLKYANAGHLPSYMTDGKGSIEAVGHSTGMVLGVDEKGSFKDGVIKLKLGDTMIFYTDGISEARYGREEFFGTSRFEALLTHNGHTTTRELCESILKSVDDFQRHELADDITIMALKRTE